MTPEDRKELAQVHGSQALALCERIANKLTELDKAKEGSKEIRIQYAHLYNAAADIRTFMKAKCGLK